MVRPPPFEDPDSSPNIVPPKDLEAVCPMHGFVATITIEQRGVGNAYVVTCGKCGKTCSLTPPS